MLNSNTRKILLATCIAAAPAYALAQSPAQTPAQQNQPPRVQNQERMNQERMTQPAPRGAQMDQQNQRMAGQTMSGKFLAAPESGQIRAEDLREADIYTEDNKKVGDIDDILLDRQGRIVAVVVGVGGFLGIGEKNVAIPFEALRMQEENVATSSVGTPPRTTSERTTERMTTGAVPDNRPVTDQDRQRATGQRAEQMGQERADRQAPGARTEPNMPGGQQRQTPTTTTTTTQQPMRTAQATGGLWKPERIILRGVTKAELEAAPEFKWDASAGARSGGATNPPPRNR